MAYCVVIYVLLVHYYFRNPRISISGAHLWDGLHILSDDIFVGLQWHIYFAFDQLHAFCESSEKAELDVGWLFQVELYNFAAK